MRRNKKRELQMTKFEAWCLKAYGKLPKDVVEEYYYKDESTLKIIEHAFDSGYDLGYDAGYDAGLWEMGVG